MSKALSELLLADNIPTDVARVFRQATVLMSSQEVDRAVDRLAIRLTVELQASNPLLLLNLPGALVLGGMLMRRLVFPLQAGFLSLVDGQVSCVGDPDQLANTTRPWVLVFSDPNDAAAQAVQGWAAALSPSQVYCVSMFAHEATQQNLSYAALPVVAQGCFGSGQSVLGYGANLGGVYQVNRKSEEG